MTRAGGALRRAWRAVFQRGGRRGDTVLAVMVALWASIWFVWPSPPRSRAPAALPAPRVSLMQLPRGQGLVYMGPTLFGRASPLGFTVAEKRDSRPGELPYRPSMPTATLTNIPPRATVETPPVFAPEIDLPDRAAWSLRMAPEQDAFALTEPPADGLQVVLRGALKEFGLRVPPFPASITNRQALAWNVRAYVETDDEGKVRNVFAEASSAEPWVRAEVIRALQASRLAKPAPPCAGRVEVGYEP